MVEGDSKRIVSNLAHSAVLELDREELITLNNALNEICNGIDLRGEFETRVGTTQKKARALLDAVNSLVSALEN
jgi:hypothetical protein